MGAAVISITTRIAKGASQSFGGRTKRPKSERLNGVELDELGYLWGAYSAALGVRSVQGAIEDRLRRGPPNDHVRRQVLEELDRAGGRAPESSIVKIIVAEGGTRYEARRAITMLVNHGKVQRVAIEPHGWDLKLPERGDITMRLALRSTGMGRRDRWKRQDAALEADCHRLVCGDDSGGISNFEPDVSIPPKRRAAVERAQAALRLMPRHLVVVLRRVYADVQPGEDELMAVGEYTKAAHDEAVARKAETVGAAIRARMRDAVWVERVRQEADKLIAAAVMGYREARKG